jgi:hypothetical protein
VLVGQGLENASGKAFGSNFDSKTSIDLLTYYRVNFFVSMISQIVHGEGFQK